jgi:predicted metal-binding membrane protein
LIGSQAVPKGGSSSADGRSAPVWTALLLLSAAAWTVTVARAREMGLGPGTMGMGIVLFTGMWTVMMAAMMWPALTPHAVRETGAIGIRAASLPRLAAIGGFASGFLLPWAVYGLAAFGALVAANRLLDASPGAARWLGVGVFATAGLYQLSPWKSRALHHCRMAMGSPLSSGPRFVRNFAAGARDGTYCVGCCWALMAVFVPAGVMNLGAMAGMGAVIFLEKVVSRPRWVSRVAGAALLLLAILAVLNGAFVPGLHAPAGPMTDLPMGGM